MSQLTRTITVTTRELAELLNVDISTVQKTVQRLNATSDVLPKYKQGQTPHFTEEQAILIKQEIQKQQNWYTIEDLASMCGMSVETLKKGSGPLVNLSIDFEVETRLGGYHNTKKFYSENVLKALKEYQLKNYVPNALKDKEAAVMGNVSFVQQATVKQTINNLLDNPDTLNMLLQESLTRNKALGIENKQLKEVLAEKTAIVNRIADGKGCYTMNQTAKALKLPYGNIKLFEKLRAMQILNLDNSPKQEQINNGNFKVVVKFINEKVGNKTVTLTTSKGLVYLAKKFNTEIDESVFPDYE